MARCREHRQRETFKKTPPTQIPSSAQPQQKKKKKKYGLVIYTAFTHFPNPKQQTYIYLSTAHFSNLQCPFGSLIDTPQNFALVPTVL